MGFGSPSPAILVPYLTGTSRQAVTWDAENRLIEMETRSIVPAGARRRLEFAYDYLSRRIWKRETDLDAVISFERKFVYDGWNLLVELDENNALVRSYVWGLDLSESRHGAGGVGGLLAVRNSDGSTHFVSYNGNGNVACLVDASTGESSAIYEYGPFGEPLRASGPMAYANPFRFSTKYTDVGSGLLYYGFRYYDPQPGRWLSRDPLTEIGGLNVFAFVANSPLHQVDALGLQGYIFSPEGMDYDSAALIGGIPHELLKKQIITISDGTESLTIFQRPPVIYDASQGKLLFPPEAPHSVSPPIIFAEHWGGEWPHEFIKAIWNNTSAAFAEAGEASVTDPTLALHFPHKGNWTTDFDLADSLAPLGPKGPNSTWHHVKDLQTMQEIDKVLHKRFLHSGGVSIINSK